MKWIVSVCVYIYSLPLEPPSHPYPPGIRISHPRAPGWAPCTEWQLLLATHFTHGGACISPTLPICPTLPFPHCVRKSISSLHLHLHSCPKTDSSVPFFQIPHTRVSMHLFFSFWLTSLCMMCDPAIPLLDIYPEKTVIHKDTCTPVFTAALFIIARTWMQPKCPLTDESIKKMWYMYTMEYYSAIKGTILDHL